MSWGGPSGGREAEGVYSLLGDHIGPVGTRRDSARLFYRADAHSPLYKRCGAQGLLRVEPTCFVYIIF